MARVPHPAPQRVSAHVVPKAQAFDADDEKTTIESGWEEEPSTTVEQGEVAEKIRALGLEQPRARNNITNITNITNGDSIVDEPTVDDQRAHAALAMITPPSLAVARLLVTQGNDTGQQLEVAPGKSYTIGRAIDNDFVLTDIAVSRKHFDLRQDAGSWMVADRGSGNGTLVNGNIEDQPFLLANGDLIEIGNTVFRFEQANAPPRARPVAGRYNIEVDEEEPSTVAGKPVRSDELSTPAQVPPPGRLRPKTVPPPAPVPPRTRNPSGPPPAYPAGSQPGAAPISSLPGMPPHLQQRPVPAPPRPSPQPQLPSKPPLSQPPRQMLQPQMLQPQMLQPQIAVPQPMLQPATTLPLPQLTGRSSIPQLAGAQGVSLVGTESMAPKGMLPTTIPGQGMPVAPPATAMPYSYPSIADMHKHGQMLVVGNGQPRDATSTALVQPTPFGALPAVAPPTYSTPPAVSRRTKLLLAGAALTLVAAVATIAIMKSSESSGTTQPSKGSDDSGSGEGSDNGALTGSDTARKPLTPSDLTDPDPAKPDPTKPDPAKPDPVKADPTKPDPIAKLDPPTPDPAEPDPAKPDPAKPDPAKPDPARPDPKIVVEPPDPAPPKPPVKPDPPRPNKPPKPPPRQNPPRQNPPRRPTVATAVRPDSSGVRSKATALYRAKKFGEAGATLRQFAATVSGTEASDLRTAASVYEQLGVAYNRGMSPGAKAADAFRELRKARNLDSGSAAGEFTSEIKARLAQVSPKAALTFYIAKDYELAFEAVRTAEGGGFSNGDTKVVRQNLEQVAAGLYAAASKEIGSNPDAAKQKLRRIRGIVDPKNPIVAKAVALLNAN